MATKSKKKKPTISDKQWGAFMRAAAKRGTKLVKPHKAVKKYCRHCKRMHTKSQHAFHGTGSFDRSHGGSTDDF